MTDFITDIKTRLIEQAAELGISRETACLLAASIDATAKDYAGDRVYIGKGGDAAQRQRNHAILRDHRNGERVPLLMRRYGISKRRLYEIIQEARAASAAN